MGAFPITGLSDPGQTSAGFSTYEQYGTEGHSSNYGPAGNKLMQDDAHVGLGPKGMMQYGLRQGDRAHIPGKGWRQINESSARKNGIEFFKESARVKTQDARQTEDRSDSTRRWACD
jgi:hypothetical protein